MLKKCYSCYRPAKSCYCRWIDPIDTGVKFVFLIHPREAYRQKTGTGRLAHLSIKDSEFIVDIDFSGHPMVNGFIRDPVYFPVVLYPGAGAYFTGEPVFRSNVENKKLLVFIIDATWSQARKIMRLSSNLHHLPKLSFQKAYRSEFIIKRQPYTHCLSTIESVYFLIRELKSGGIINNSVNPEGLIRVFRKMVNYQLSHFKQRKDQVKSRGGGLL